MDSLSRYFLSYKYNLLERARYINKFTYSLGIQNFGLFFDLVWIKFASSCEVSVGMTFNAFPHINISYLSKKTSEVWLG